MGSGKRFTVAIRKDESTGRYQVGIRKQEESSGRYTSAIRKDASGRDQVKLSGRHGSDGAGGAGGGIDRVEGDSSSEKGSVGACSAGQRVEASSERNDERPYAVSIIKREGCGALDSKYAVTIRCNAAAASRATAAASTGAQQASAYSVKICRDDQGDYMIRILKPGAASES